MGIEDWGSDRFSSDLQQVEKSSEIVALELFRRHELPQDRPEPVAEPRQPLRQEFLDRTRAFGQHLAIGPEARCLAAEPEPIGHRRSDERRVGTEGVSTVRSRGSPVHSKKTKIK